jgi:hypothetical protein
MTGGWRGFRPTVVALVALSVVLLSTACGSDGDDGKKKASGDRTSSTLILEEGGPKGGLSGPVAVAGFDPGTGALVVVRGAPPGPTEIIVDETSIITVQGPDGPQPLPVDELAPWIAERLAGLPDGTTEVPMTIEAEMVDDGSVLQVVSLTEIPPG